MDHRSVRHCGDSPAARAPGPRTPPRSRRRRPPRRRRRHRRHDPGATTSGAPAGAVSGTPARRSMRPPRSRIPNNILSKRSIYFDYDQFVIKDEYRPIDRGAREVSAGQPQRAGDAAGPHRRARHARVQHRARPEARRRGEEADGAAGRHRDPDRDGELRQGKAAPRRPRRSRRGPRTAASTSSTPASERARRGRRRGASRTRTVGGRGVSARCAALRAAALSPRGWSRCPRAPRSSTTRRRASASSRRTSAWRRSRSSSRTAWPRSKRS